MSCLAFYSGSITTFNNKRKTFNNKRKQLLLETKGRAGKFWHPQALNITLLEVLIDLEQHYINNVSHSPTRGHSYHPHPVRTIARSTPTKCIFPYNRIGHVKYFAFVELPRTPWASYFRYLLGYGIDQRLYEVRAQLKKDRSATHATNDSIAISIGIVGPTVAMPESNLDGRAVVFNEKAASSSG